MSWVALRRGGSNEILGKRRDESFWFAERVIGQECLFTKYNRVFLNYEQNSCKVMEVGFKMEVELVHMGRIFGSTIGG